MDRFHSRAKPASIVCSVLLIVVTSACRQAPSEQAAPVAADTWAVVDGREIKRDQVERTYRRVSDLNQPLSEEETLGAQLNILDDLITQDLLIAKAAALKVDLPDTEVDSAYAEARKGIPDDAFQQELTRRNLTAGDMRDGLRRELLAQKVVEREVSSKVTVTDQEVTSFFESNRAQFNLPEEAFHIAQIVVTPGREGQVTNRTGDDAATPQAAAAKVQMVMAKLKEGAAFGDLARDYSEDPESAPRGGDMGLVPMSALQQAPPALRDAVLKVTTGSARVATQNGVHTIVYVLAREPAGQRDLSTPGVRDRITATLRGRRDQLLRAAYLTSLRSDAEIVNYLARQLVQSQGKTPPR